jgi:chromosome segregation ATPase
MTDDIEQLRRTIEVAVIAMEEAGHIVTAQRSEIDRLREERAQLRRALYEVNYCLSAMEVQPSAMTKTTADTLVQLNLGGFND